MSATRFMKCSFRHSLLIAGKLFLFLFVQSLDAQTIPVGSDDILRQLQLQGKLDSRSSLCARPFFSDTQLTTDSLSQLIEPRSDFFSIRKRSVKGSGVYEVLPFTVNTRFNSHQPYGWNQPGMIQAKGLQTVIGAGIYASAGIIDVQLSPYFAYAANPDFAHNAFYGTDKIQQNYHHLFFGQSSVRINAGALSLGISTENIGWGPGMYNSLLMSSNAPGFLHITFNTRKPLKTAIGSFEWQLISGKLYEDTTLMMENKMLTTNYYNPDNYYGNGYTGPYDPKKKWRYFNGITITYQPKWIPGLFLGVNRIGYAYNDLLTKGNQDFFQSYLPVIFGVFRQNYAYGLDLSGGSKRYKQMASVHMRYLFPESHAEVYGEYGWGDNQYNLRDFLLNIDHSRAFILGARKMKWLGGDRWLDFHFEMTQMSQGPSGYARSAGNWYGYQGSYTNQNRIIGAGIGMGSNVQTMSVTWIKGFTKLGIKLEWLQHDPNEYPAKWVDGSIGFSGQKKYRRFLLTGECKLIRSKNYIWEAGNTPVNIYTALQAVYKL